MKKNNTRISVIVPVYNVEKYLKECLDSIINQTLENIEIIIIDDGSTDTSPIIVDHYAKKDSRIKAIHQKNHGYSYTINKGIELARGDYIGIVESDDFIEKDMYEKLLNVGLEDNSDVIKGGFFIYNSLLPKDRQNKYFACPSGVDLRNAPTEAFTIEEWPELIALHSSIWSSIYRSNILKKCKVPESAGASYQDLPFMFTIMSKAKKISVVKKGFYHWRNEPNQQHSTSVKGKKALMMIKNSKLGVDIIKKTKKYNDLKEAIYIHILWANLPFLYNIERKYRKTYCNNLHSLLSPIKKDKQFKFRFFRKSDKLLYKTLIINNYTITNIAIILAKTRKYIKHLITN